MGDLGNVDMAQRLGCHPATAGEWCKRYAVAGMPGLGDALDRELCVRSPTSRGGCAYNASRETPGLRVVCGVGVVVCGLVLGEGVEECEVGFAYV